MTLLVVVAVFVAVVVVVIVVTVTVVVWVHLGSLGFTWAYLVILPIAHLREIWTNFLYLEILLHVITLV